MFCLLWAKKTTGGEKQMKCKKCNKQMELKQNKFLEGRIGYKAIWMCKDCNIMTTDLIVAGELKGEYERIYNGR